MGLPGREAWFVAPQNTSPQLQSPVEVCFTPRDTSLGDARLGCICSAMFFAHCSSANLKVTCSHVTVVPDSAESLLPYYVLQRPLTPLCELV